MGDFYADISKCLVGIVRVDISLIDFPTVGDDSGFETREFDAQIAERLAVVYADRRWGCDRMSPKNHLRADIDAAKLDSILRGGQITMEDLARSLKERIYPRIYFLDHKILCPHGQHRTGAARKFLDPDDQWWTIDLYLFQPGR